MAVIKQSRKSVLKVAVLLLSTAMIASCSTNPDVSNARFLGLLLDQTEPQKPIPCEKPAKDDPYPAPQATHLQSPIDDIEQGGAYGTAYLAGKDHYELREKEQGIYWKACDKQHDADNIRYEQELAARKKAREELDKILNDK